MIHRAAKRRVKDYTAPNRLHVDTQQCSSKYLQNCAGWDLFSHIEHFKKKRGEKDGMTFLHSQEWELLFKCTLEKFRAGLEALGHNNMWSEGVEQGRWKRMLIRQQHRYIMSIVQSYEFFRKQKVPGEHRAPVGATLGVSHCDFQGWQRVLCGDIHAILADSPV